MNAVIGRNKEISTLAKALTSSKPELIAIYGRPRVGKTFLIREVYKSQINHYGLKVHRFKKRLKVALLPSSQPNLNTC